MVGVADTVADARWFPEALDAQNMALAFVRTDRSTITSKAFLSESLWSNEDLPRTRGGLETLVRALPGTASLPKIDFIWHASYCCSTLISQTLDRPGKNLSIREPDALTTLARMKRGTRGMTGPGATRYLGMLLSLLGRPFVDGEHVTLKPANAANNLIGNAAALTSGKMLFLYSDCRSFLISVARGGETRRAFVRRLFAEILVDDHEQKNWSKARFFEMSDLELAAIVWHMQIAEFRRWWPLLGERAASLHCDAFLSDPETALTRLDAFFGFGLGAEHVAEILSGQMLKRNAKALDEPLDYEKRRQQQAAIPARLSREVDEIVAWSYDMCKSTPRGRPLENPILEVDTAAT